MWQLRFCVLLCSLLCSRYTYCFDSINILKSPKNYFPKSGKLRMSCAASGSLPVKIVWYYSDTMTPVLEDKKLIATVETYSQHSVIQVDNPLPKVTYKFYCNASNSNGEWSVSDEASMGLAYLDKQYKVNPVRLKIVKQGSSVTLSCSSPNGSPKPSVKWLKSNKVIQNIKSYSTAASPNRIISLNRGSISILSIKNSQLGDSGAYRCLAVNKIGHRRSTETVLLIKNSSNQINFTKINIISSKLSDVTELNCVNAPNNTKINWISSKSIDLSRYTTSKLIIRTAQLHSTYYVCFIKNPTVKLLSVFWIYPQLKRQKRVIKKKSIKIREKVVIEGANIVLECDPHNKYSKIYWETPTGSPIFPDSFRNGKKQHIRIINSDLHIQQVRIDDAGKYVCNVHSALKVVDFPIRLRVLQPQIDMYPIIALPPQNRTVGVGDRLELFCETMGSNENQIKISWYVGKLIKQPLSIMNNPRFRVQNEKFVIEKVQIDDTNFYTCEAENDQGRRTMWVSYVAVIAAVGGSDLSQAPLAIDRAALPAPPVVSSPFNITSTSLSLSWSDPVNLDSNERLVYWIEFVCFGWKRGWRVFRANYPFRNLTVTGLRPGSLCQFLVRARNRIGVGRASVPTEYVRLKDSEQIRSDILSYTFDKIHFISSKSKKPRSISLGFEFENFQFFTKESGSTRNTVSGPNIQFKLNYHSVSVLNCILFMANGLPLSSSIRSNSDSNKGRGDDSLITSDDRITIFTGNSNFQHYCSLINLTQSALNTIGKHYQPISTAIRTINLSDKLFPLPNISKSSFLPLQTSLSGKMWQPFHCYNISLTGTTSTDSVVRSNYRLLLIPEAKPDLSPTNLVVRWSLPRNDILLHYSLPPSSSFNGLLVGTNVYIRSNQSQLILKFNDTKPSKVLININTKLSWYIKVSLVNCIGEGPATPEKHLPSLSHSLNRKTQSTVASLLSRPWIIVLFVFGVLTVWLLLTVLLAYIFCVRPNKPAYHQPSKTMDNQTVNNNKQPPVCYHESMKKEEPHQDNPIPVEVGYCNPYAASQLLDKSGGALSSAHPTPTATSSSPLYYMSSPIFDPTATPAKLMNMTATNKTILENSTVNNAKPAAGWIKTNQTATLSSPQKCDIECQCSSDAYDLDDIIMEHVREHRNSFVDQSGLDNLLINAIPFSDQFSKSSNNETPSSSSVSGTAYRKQTCDNKSRRRQDTTDNSQSSEAAIHLLEDSCSAMKYPLPANLTCSLYDTPYSTFPVDT